MVVLAFIVLLTMLIVSFFSRTVSSRQLAHVSSNQSMTTILGDSALAVIVGDLQYEIVSGSNSDGGTPPIYSPKGR